MDHPPIHESKHPAPVPRNSSSHYQPGSANLRSKLYLFGWVVNEPVFDVPSEDSQTPKVGHQRDQHVGLNWGGTGPDFSPAFGWAGLRSRCYRAFPIIIMRRAPHRQFARAKLWNTERSSGIGGPYGIRSGALECVQLAAAFSPASSLAGTRACREGMRIQTEAGVEIPARELAGRNCRKQACGRESGSELPHSKASLRGE